MIGKLATFIVSMLAAALACDAQQSDLAELKLQGKVRAVTDRSFDVVKGNGKLVNELKTITSYTFDKRGNKVKEEVRNADGSLESRATHFYSPTGLLEQDDTYNADGTPGFTNIYTYNEDSDLATIAVYNGSGNLFLKTVCGYDAKGNETTETNYLPVSEKNNKVRTVLQNVITWQRDEQGRPIKEQLLEAGRVAVSTTTYAYDAKGNLAERVNTENGVTLKTTFKYDGKNRLIEEVRYDGDDQVERRIVTMYDDRGNETEVSIYDKDDRMQAISLFKLTLDKQGNWIKKVQSDNERTTGVVEREIVYY